MIPATENFVQSAEAALKDRNLAEALARSGSGFIDKRSHALAEIENFEELRARGATIKDEVLDRHAHYLSRFEERAIAGGAKVHWARDGSELNRIVSGICKRHSAKRIIKGKSMVAEECGLNEALIRDGYRVTETDLGEYIIQLAGETPSHIVAPAVHKTKEEVSDLFLRHHDLGERSLKTRPEMVNEARRVLRDSYLEADVGITGANFLIADIGGMMLVTNEGNGDLCARLPRVHIAIAGIEKLAPGLEDAFCLLRLLTRSATGQPITSYVSILRGPAAAEDADGPSELHYVLLDGGRSEIAAGPMRSVLRCIRCGACMNHCPVYTSVGGHAYGWVYPGPLGAVLTPLLTDAHSARHLPNASSFCGRCAEVCPVKIPLPDLMRQLRDSDTDKGGWLRRTGMRLYMRAALHPRLFRFLSRRLAAMLRMVAGKHKQQLPFGAAAGWLSVRDLPAPQSERELAELRAEVADMTGDGRK